MQDENLFTPNSIRTFTGQYVNLSDPQLETIYPTDIAIGLARLCRFGGHTKKFYSVAEHSVYCMILAEQLYPNDQKLAFEILLHDAHEAYLGDMVSPLKDLIPKYDDIANKLQNVIHQRFGVSKTHVDHDKIKEIDRKALQWEWEHKVLNNYGLEMDDRSRADLFIHHFVRLCKHPFLLQ